MVLRNGRVLAEGWWAPYRADLKHSLYSLSKSFTSTAVGLAVAEGFFAVDDTVISFFPDRVPETVSDNLAAMTVRHLLTMSVGQESEDRSSDDWVKTFLAIPVEHEPGSTFRYNTSATFMLSAIVQETTGKTLMEFLTPRFFQKLGIEGATWEMSPKGYNTGGYGLSVKTEDIARLGQFYLQQGAWKGEQILSPAWVEEATSAQIESSPGSPPPEGVISDWSQGYGYQFWRTTHGAFRGDGAFGQFSIVYPEQDAFIAVTGGSSDMQGMLDVIWEYLYPAYRTSPMPEDKEGQA
jgi:CubicO group peptidase (beta-lactamase class C family)